MIDGKMKRKYVKDKGKPNKGKLRHVRINKEVIRIYIKRLKKKVETIKKKISTRN